MLRRRTPALGLALLCALAVTLSAVGSAQAAKPGAAATLLARTIADARASGSFHEVISQLENGTHVGFVAQIGATSGRQLITTSRGTRAQVVVSGGMAYLSGNSTALVHYFGLPARYAAAIGRRWISFSRSDPGYQSVAVDVTTRSALSELVPAGVVTERAVTLAGRPLIALRGTVPGAAKGTAGVQTLYVTRGADPLPVQATMDLRKGGRVQATGTITTTAWGTPVAIAAPPRPIPVTDLTVLVQERAAMAITDTPGYTTFLSSSGEAPTVGRPWGRACEPVRFAFSPAAPQAIYSQAAAAVAAARAQGIDVTLETPALTWKHNSLYYRRGQSPATAAQVTIALAAGSPPGRHGAKSTPITIHWHSAADVDGHNIDLRQVSATVWEGVIAGRPERLRRAIRRLIAFTQGVGATTVPGSGIAPHGADAFTTADVAAMLEMSGCTRIAPSGLAA